MYTKFEDLIEDLSNLRPSENGQDGKTFYFNDQPVSLQAGEMETVHWVDIHIELKRFRIDSIGAAMKVLQANLDMGAATPIPTWFAVNGKTQNVVFVNRLDWRHITVDVLDSHIIEGIK